MPYQIARNPIIYINIYEYAAFLGLIQIPKEAGFLRLNPSEYYNMIDVSYENSLFGLDVISYDLPLIGVPFDKLIGENGFIALLGHKLATIGTAVSIGGNWSTQGPVNIQEIVNAGIIEPGNGFIYPENNGLTFCSCSFENLTEWDLPLSLHFYGLDKNFTQTCSAIIGSTYQFPRGSDIGIKITREMDGIKNFRTPGGKDLTNHRYIKSNNWGDYAPFEIYPGEPLAYEQIDIYAGIWTEVYANNSFTLDYTSLWGGQYEAVGQGLKFIGEGHGFNSGWNDDSVQSQWDPNYPPDGKWRPRFEPQDYTGIGTIEQGQPYSLYSEGWQWADNTIIKDFHLEGDEPTNPFDYDGQKFSRVGRRIWELSFTLPASDIWGINPTMSFSEGNMGPTINNSPWNVFQGLQDNLYDPLDEAETTQNFGPNGYVLQQNVLSDYNFFSSVIMRTIGGKLPMLFSADADDPNPDNLAIVKLDMKSIKCTQIANVFYRMKIKLKELF